MRIEDGLAIDVLDHGYVRLVDHMGNDVSVVRAARVSFNLDDRAGRDLDADKKLIRYLWSHHHTTPFESVVFTFEVKAPLFVLRQWQRHRTWSYNEVSGRYRELEPQIYVPALREQGRENKQGSGGPLNSAPLADAYKRSAAMALDTYRALLDAGVTRELAGCVLPLSLYTRMYATVNLLNLLKFLTLRMDKAAQWEIRQYAEALRTLAGDMTPMSIGVWSERFFNRESEHAD